jgi:hypothetical protein
MLVGMVIGDAYGAGFEYAPGGLHGATATSAVIGPPTP